MALDGHMFDSNNVMIDFFPINDDLHKAIFYQKENIYISFLYLTDFVIIMKMNHLMGMS
ncbi:hypothetical protein [Paenibacillus alba]|uniref:Uncharacterized protein n=1 Tax=Paenibacillus alba TaxID=1197127 RepID=A0ABU6G977_9BACL|nr:hypothetical protein [Paenibacillus alba]MEC0229299.1 hypothetical protein [Paenibacillus alba]